MDIGAVVNMMVVLSENHASTHQFSLPREIDSLGPANEVVRQAALAAVVPRVCDRLGFAFRAEDITGVRWTPEPKPGTSLSQYAAEGGKMHLLLINPERGAIGRLRHMADALKLQGEQLKAKDEEIENLREQLREKQTEIAMLRTLLQQQHNQKQ